MPQHRAVSEQPGTGIEGFTSAFEEDGHVVWGHLTCTLVRGGDGVAAHFITQVQDITERKLGEQALRRSEERAGHGRQPGLLRA